MKDFIEDLKPPEALWGIILKSKVSSGKIEDIILSKIPKEITIISSSDIPGRNALSVFENEMPLLADGKIEYIGQPVLLLAGPDLKTLRSTAEQIIITTRKSDSARDRDFAGEIVYEKAFTSGKPDRIFKKAFQLIEGEYRTPWQEHHYSDACAALAVPDKKGITITCPSQWIFNTRMNAAEALGKPEKEITVNQSLISPSYDGKLWFPTLLAVHAALLAEASGKSVFLFLDREEEIACSPKRMPVTTRIKTAINQDGNLIAVEAEAIADTGAFLLMGEEIANRVAKGIKGIYSCDNISITVKCLKSAFPPFGAFRGLGSAQGFFASELHMTRIAELSLKNPAVWKKNNLGSIPLKNSPTHVIQSLIDDVSERSDFHRKHSAYEMQNKARSGMSASLLKPRGIGISSAYQFNGFTSADDEKASISMRMDLENKLHIRSSIIPSGKWIEEQWISLASEILGLARGDVRLECGSTDYDIDSGPDIFGRNISVAGKLIRRCAQAIAKKRFRAPLPLTVKRALNQKVPEESRVLEIADIKSETTWGACVVELEIDLFTLLPEIKAIWITVACGEISSRDKAVSHVEGAVLQTLQWCTRDNFIPFHPEEFRFHYHLPRVTAVPRIYVDFIIDKQRTAISVEDIADILLPPAYVSAVSQAAGYYFDRIPITPIEIANSMEEG